VVGEGESNVNIHMYTLIIVNNLLRKRRKRKKKGKQKNKKGGRNVRPVGQGVYLFGVWIESISGICRQH
jgi:hypothetical protein